jgi:hypothetical protein
MGIDFQKSGIHPQLPGDICTQIAKMAQGKNKDDRGIVSEPATP